MAANDEKVQESVNQFLSDVKRFALLLFVNCRVIVDAIKGMECSPEFKKSLDTVAGCFEMSASSVTSDSYNPLLAKCTSEVHIAVLVLEFVSPGATRFPLFPQSEFVSRLSSVSTSMT